MENYSENSLESILAKRMSFGTRFGAWIVDIILIIILALTLGGAIGTMFGLQISNAISKEMTPEAAELAKVGTSAMGIIAGMMTAFVGLVVGLPTFSIIFFLLEAFTGRTPGKFMFGLVVANENGTKGNINTLGLRALVKALPYIFTLVGIYTKIGTLETIGSSISFLIFIGCFFVLDPKKQAFHDLIAKTAVFRASEIERN